ncbi:MAG: polyprenyl synthetase family protein [Chlorobi bacterium CHB2]|nr:polyprenyl synthetase family protein [Chlorobi bacterium CHB2]
MTFDERYQRYRAEADRRIIELLERTDPASLYQPTRYVLEAGGKRVRAVLVMLAAEAVGGEPMAALDAGAAVEILHNFTLVHDDIMDRSATRRGRQTVHTRWDEGTAILVGDVMIGIAYQIILKGVQSRQPQVMAALSQGLVDVCEGQMLDKDFETRQNVCMDDYLQMVTMKTGRLLETAAEVGAQLGGGTPQQIAALCRYARQLGIAFQIQDDLLDITAEAAELGKPIGGDVVEGKRTWLVVRALERATLPDDRQLLSRFLSAKGFPPEEVPAMRSLFQRNGVIEAAQQEVRLHTERAEQELQILPEGEPRQMLLWFTQMLLNRRF